MTPEEIARLRGLCERATAGPWWKNCVDYNRWIIKYQWNDVPTWVLETSVKDAEANADFVIASRTALPLLIAEVEYLQTKIEAMEVIYKEDLEVVKQFGPVREGSNEKTLQKQVLLLEARIAKLDEALKFYAEMKNFSIDPKTHETWLLDNGEIARRAREGA